MKWHLDDLPVFLAVVEQGGVAAAARALGAPKSSVSTALARLERGLGLRLVERLARSVRLTAEGERFHAQAQLILEQAREADALMAGLGATPSGRLSVALPPAFCQEKVAPRLAEFQRRWPGVELDIVITPQGAELLRDRVEVAVVVGQLEDSEQVCRTLLTGELVWVASPRWLAEHAPGATLAEVRAQVRLCETRYALRRLPVQVHGVPQLLDLERGISHVNDPLVVRRAVMAGAGLSMLPRHYCTEQLAEGSLVEVLPHIRFEQAASRLTVVYPSRRLLSPRVRVFLDFLAECCA